MTWSKSRESLWPKWFDVLSTRSCRTGTPIHRPRLTRPSALTRWQLIRTATSGIVAYVLVDTDVFIDHLRGAKPIKVGRNRLHYSVITRAELFAGTSASDVITRLLEPFCELVVDRAVAERAGRIRHEAGVRLPDALIAATALEHGMSLATRNRLDFEAVRGLRLRSVS